jgi:hypothetical protein
VAHLPDSVPPVCVASGGGSHASAREWSATPSASSDARARSDAARHATGSSVQSASE